MMSKFSKEIVEAINKVLPDALKTKIKEHIKLSNEVKLAEAVTADGKTLSFEGEKLAVDTKVSVKDGDVLTPADGKFEVVNPDGTMVAITAVAGVVTEVTDVVEAKKEEPKAPDAAPAAVDPMANMATQMSKQKSEFEAKFTALETKLSKEIETLKADNKVLLEMANALSTTPVKEPVAKNTKSYDEMSNHEKLLFNKGKL